MRNDVKSLEESYRKMEAIDTKHTIKVGREVPPVNPRKAKRLDPLNPVKWQSKDAI